jgi:hypothetical protein
VKLTDRDRRLIPLLALGLVALIAAQFWPQQDVVAPVQDTTRELDVARKQLDRYRAVASTLANRSQDKKKADTLLATAEKRLIQAETTAQAQAQLLQIFRRVVRAQGYALEFRNNDIGRVRPQGEYTAILVNLSFECQIETLVNLLADLSAQPELLSWDDLHLTASDPRQKKISVGITLLGFGPKKLLPKGSPQV